MTNCKNCQTDFEITEKDREYYKKFNVLEPTLCPECRSQRRTAFTNHMNLYKRKCDSSGVEMFSAYHPDTPFKVYELEHWNNPDTWDPTDYGRDYDFNRPFFEQYKELLAEVPRPALVRGFQFDENSDYTNYAGKNKNCYMIFDSDNNWDCYYNNGISSCKSSVDNYKVNNSELCYNCIDCVDSYHLLLSQDCTNCSDSAFLKNCIGCKNCFMCTNLKNKEYYIYNKQSTKEEYERLMQSLGKRSEVERLIPHWEEFKVKYPQRYMHGHQNENVIGDYVVNSKDAEYCYDSEGLWDCRYVNRSVTDVKSCMDGDELVDHVELVYEGNVIVYNTQNIICGSQILTDCHDIYYSMYCHYSSDLFGCYGIRRGMHCILNKQYSKEEYDELVPKIIEHMKSTKEFGEFFPIEFSDFGYNETVANDFFPLTKEEAQAKGYKWRDPDPKEYKPATAELPDDSADANNDLCKEIFACKDCGRNYKILEHEIKLYKQITAPLPNKCFYCSHKDRFNMRNKRKLYTRSCDKTGEQILTTYAPDSGWIVYSEKAYQDSLE